MTRPSTGRKCSNLCSRCSSAGEPIVGNTETQTVFSHGVAETKQALAYVETCHSLLPGRGRDS